MGEPEAALVVAVVVAELRKDEPEEAHREGEPEAGLRRDKLTARVYIRIGVVVLGEEDVVDLLG